MKTSRILISLSLLFVFFTIAPIFAEGEEKRTNANLTGQVLSQDGESIPFATINIVNTTIGTATDETGKYSLANLPTGSLRIKAQYLGYKPKVIEIQITEGETKEVKFELEEDVLGIEEIVVTADRNEKNRKESSTIVNTLTSKLFNTVQAVTLSDGLNYCPGVRMESNCQNCGFSQVRMNGMEGPYSQILINSRPIFSGLAGVYGLELIPSNMIERIEVIRGGGSALYGSNAIAGTINLILKDPINNSYEFGAGSGLIGLGMDESGGTAQDHTVNFNTSVVSQDNKTGMAVYGFYRNKEPFDANDDSFSELMELNNTTIGGRIYHRFDTRDKITADFFNIKESRRGGNKFDMPHHMADISEAVEHNITTGAVSYDRFFREADKLSVYVSGQNVDRDSYYGANQSLSDYGNTKDFSYTAGAQYNAVLGETNLLLGIEDNGAWLTDKKLGYINEEGTYVDNRIVADQASNTFGSFMQYEFDLSKLNVSVGARFDHYTIEDESNGSSTSGDVLSPRVTLKYDILSSLQARASYSQGYRAPQIFDEDLHIETSGAKKVIHENADALEQETSHSYMFSLDFNKQLGTSFLNLLAEGFYTQLDNAFANEFGEPNADGTVVYTRVNAEKGATVQGVNIEANFVPSSKVNLKGGFTIQTSEYEEVHELNETKFFRTPENYGYFALDWDPVENLCISSTGNYTGSMLVPYNESVLRESDPFYELGAKIRYNIKINGAKLQLYAGMKNIFNSYQDDFDSGINRDPAYVYGPTSPRTFYFGIKLGNMLD
ncbi:TonB-dependent receptor [Marinilabilia rubra]|uniref:TonB-dependent receptor n=1 Tax=Marinilabilia rubra TaxID=2162893 RepID=A0A2U2B4R7_9BACT|nr:TonB-dependent receptor [Marinilabilia rubra]PWD98052.1 TonB-dependent receptor [Marinilabilia rubra]